MVRAVVKSAYKYYLFWDLTTSLVIYYGKMDFTIIVTNEMIINKNTADILIDTGIERECVEMPIIITIWNVLCQ